MSELQEITQGKSLDDLQRELDFQIGKGESLGGCICSAIIEKMDVKNRTSDTVEIKGGNFITPTKLKQFVNNIGLRVEVSQGTDFDKKDK